MRRYKRFLADIDLDDGTRITAHCADPGSMRDCARPGASVRCSVSEDPRRKYRHTWELVRVRRTWVGVHPARANALVRAGLEAAAFPPFAAYRGIHAERRCGDSRFDFYLDDHRRGAAPLWLEVKSVTLASGRAGRFPDSVTERGRRHAEGLAARREVGERAALLFLVQRADCDRVAPADDIDPAYGEALRSAKRRGVDVWAWRSRPGPRALVLDRPLEVRL